MMLSSRTIFIVILIVVLIGASALAFVSLNPYRLQGTSVASGDVRGSLEFGGLTRTYLIHIPPSYDGKSAVPFLLVFHGGGGTGAGMAMLTHLSDTADTYGYIAVYPDGYKNQ